jgi:hypothetical protein
VHKYLTDPLNPDTDGDSWSDGEEVHAGSDPLDPNSKPNDADGDGMDDDWELANGLDPTDPTDADKDKDGDGLSNRDEFKYGTNPNKGDTDGDSFSDYDEIQSGTDPLNAKSNPAQDPRNYIDIGKGLWYDDAIKAMLIEAIVSGSRVEGGKYEIRPNDPIKRAEFVKLLTVMSGQDMTQDFTITSAFSDIKDDGAWYNSYVTWGYERGILKGYDWGEFLPNKEISREEMAAIIARYANFMKLSLPKDKAKTSSGGTVFSDETQIQEWAYADVKTIQAAGISNGDDYDNFNPQSNTLRSEAIKMLYELLLLIRPLSQ